jgi:vacuolar protein sorting-associated protein 18
VSARSAHEARNFTDYLGRAMRFLKSTDLLKIEDILPFFPDFVVIDDFKDEIANALESYSAQIEALKSEMDDAMRSAESMKEYIVGLKNRFITVDAGERCSVCSIPILTRKFYVFPCHHAFHADCLVGLVRGGFLCADRTTCHFFIV